MMSLPDFKEKQLLIVTASDIAEDRLQFKNDNICLTRDGAIINQLSCHKVFALFVIGDCTITTVLIRNCQYYGVSLFLLRDNFLAYASLISVAEGNYLLREKQYNRTDTFDIAKRLVANKLFNQYILLHPDEGKKKMQEQWDSIVANTQNILTSKELLGYEGSNTKQFFASYFGDIGWYKRMPRAKVDEINVLMDIGYTMLFNFVDAITGLFGFDSYKGVYHTLFFQRKSLICDLVEPFRCIINKQIVKSFNLKQVDKKDFTKTKGVYSLSFAKQKKYILIFSDVLMENKEDIFCFIRDYYYCMMNDTKDYPRFTIK